MEDTAAEMTPVITDYSHPVTAPFGQISECKSKEDVVKLTAQIISERLNHGDVNKQKLMTALQVYFDEAGIENESQLTSMDPSDWPLDVIKEKKDELKPLTKPVMSTLKKVASYMGLVMRKQLYVRRTSTFKELESFAEKLQWNDEVLKSNNMSVVGTAPSKIPDFVVPQLNENDKDEQEYLKKIEQVFTSNALQKFLTSAQHCEQHSE